ncbi:MAG: phage/plasmid primase, P4 family [Clostridiales bacterium]|nr:phage/plasmid primase, P4 family [Clostridiales bacterium]
MENAARCKPPLTDRELEATVFPALSRWQKGTAPYDFARPSDLSLAARLEELRPEKNGRYGWNDVGNGNLFSDLCRGVACYVPVRGKWYFYTGSRWKADTGDSNTREYCKRMTNELLAYAGRLPDGTEKEAYAKYAAKLLSLNSREKILRDANSVAPVDLSEFDSNPYLFNCQNGTIDLKTGEFHAHDPADRITMFASVSYDPSARCERWEQYISGIFDGDAELSVYLQKALGYALTGDTRYECFFILYGPTSRNGKGTLRETLLRLTGDYGKSADPTTVALRKNNDSRNATEDLARLVGVRFVSMSEPDKEMRFDAAKLKTITGGGSIPARNLYENSFEYIPQFKIFLDTNHLPYISDATLFSSDRVKVIPFNKHFEEAERDTRLKAELQKPENLSGILNWCIEGLKLLRAEGWKTPAAVKAAIEKYEDSSDKLKIFIDETLQKTEDGECEARVVHGIYQNWCFDNGCNAEGFSEFTKSLDTKAIKVERKRPLGAGASTSKKSMIVGYTIRGNP